MAQQGFGNSKKSVLIRKIKYLNKKKKATLFSLIGLIGLLTISAVYILLTSNSNLDAKSAEDNRYVPGIHRTISVFTPVSDVSPGTALAAVKFNISELKEDSEDAAKAISKDVVTSADQIVEKFAKFTIKAGTPVTANLLTDKPETARVVPLKGMQATVVRIADGESLTGVVRQGSKVDVILTYQKAGQFISQRIAENIKVLLLSNDQLAEPSRRRRGSAASKVTLEVEPKQSLQFKTFARMGELSLVLRSPDDLESTAQAIFSEQQIREGAKVEDKSEKDDCSGGAMLVDGKKFCL